MNFLRQFIHSEMNQYRTPDDGLFALGLNQVADYYEFLLIITERHKAVTETWNLVLEYLRQPAVPIDCSKIRRETRELLRNPDHSRLFTQFYLETETFFLFAKILLDKIAIFLRDYFPQTTGISLISHSKLTKEYEKFAKANDLTTPEGFLESLSFLQEHICNYRDKQITHLMNLRTIKGIDPDGFRVTTGYANYKAADKFYRSTNVEKLLQAITTYAQQTIRLIGENRHRSRFKLIHSRKNQGAR